MTTQKFHFLIPQSQEKSRIEYQLLLEKAKAIYFSSLKKPPTVFIWKNKIQEAKVFDIITKHNYHNEETIFCSSDLLTAGTREWTKHLIKFFFDNKNDQFSLELVSSFFGKFCSFFH